VVFCSRSVAASIHSTRRRLACTSQGVSITISFARLPTNTLGSTHSFRRDDKTVQFNTDFAIQGQHKHISGGYAYDSFSNDDGSAVRRYFSVARAGQGVRARAVPARRPAWRAAGTHQQCTGITSEIAFQAIQRHLMAIPWQSERERTRVTAPAGAPVLCKRRVRGGTYRVRSGQVSARRGRPPPGRWLALLSR